MLLTAFCFFCFSYQLGEVPPYHTDENFYVLSAKNMLQSGDYLTPVFHEKKRFAKPILFYWQVALSYKVFGISLVSARLWSVVLGTSSAVLVFFLGRRLFSSQAAMLGALILPSIYLHFQISRWATTDMTLSFFILCAFYFFIKGFQEESHRTRNYVLFYLSMAMGFLTKGPPAILIPALTIATFLFIRGDWKRIVEMRLPAGLLILMAVDIPWFAAMYVLHGEEFTNHLLGAELRDRIVHETPFSFYYLGVLIRYYLPWSLFLVFSIATLTANFKTRILNFFDKENYALLFCFLWIFIPILLFTAFRIEHSRYLLPTSPAMALILGHYFTRLAISDRGFKRPVFKIPFYLTLFIFFLLTLAVAAGVILMQSDTSVPFRIMFLPLFLAAGPSIMILMFIARRRIALIVTLAAFQTLSLSFIHGDAIPFFNRYPMKKFAQEIIQTRTGNEIVGVFQLGSHQARVGVLTGQTAKFIFLPEWVRDFVNDNEKFYLIMKESEWKEKFNDLDLVLRSSDTIWKKRRIDKDFLRKLWHEGLHLNPSDHLETIVLLTPR
ncbi:MAG: dolichyl-phosphate-mannose--protein mannosyltransferase [Nitrospinaceae bacterium]|nr:MAG: dolichyl-phosphate-mannose--protein mannosyltransferase [Nitrospinaceae bacterium]